MIVERNLPLVSIITPPLNLLQGDATKARTTLGWKPSVLSQKFGPQFFPSPTPPPVEGGGIS